MQLMQFTRRTRVWKSVTEHGTIREFKPTQLQFVMDAFDVIVLY